MHFQIPKQQWTKIEEYLQGLPQEEMKGLQKSDYLDLMEQLLGEYDLERVCDPKEDLQAYCRLMSVLAVLLSNGRKTNLQARFCEMLIRACEELSEYSGNPTSDIATKELRLVLFLIKEIDMNGDWAKMLSSKEGICDTTESCKEYLSLQAAKSDENGMVQNNEGSEYFSAFDDLFVRFQLQLTEHFGGSSFGEGLRRAGVWSLMTQSATGQLPYGGRSNQAFFHETLLASVLEYEAGKQAEEGNFVLAGRMRRGARLAAESVQKSLNCHNLNRYSEIGYPYEKDRISAATSLIGAVLFAHEDLPEHPAPCERGGYILSFSSKFHQIFANSCGYSIQIDANGESDWDATGLGRIQKQGIPENLGLSVPFGKGAVPEGGKPFSASIGIGWDDGEGGVQYLADLTGIKYALSIVEEKEGKLKFTITYTGNCLKNCGGIMETYSLDESGLRYSAKLLESECKAVYARVPLFVTDGAQGSNMKQKAGQTNVYLDQFRWRMTTNASLSPDEVMAENRNGAYKIVTLVRLEPKIRLNLSLCLENERE